MNTSSGRGVNDAAQDIRALIDFCQHISCKVNLIDYNPIEEGFYRQADEAAVSAYEQALGKAGIPVSRRRESDIDAACGQLANRNR